MRSTSSHSRKVALGFKYGAADESVGAALHFDALLEANIGQWNIELGRQELTKIGLDLVMSGLARKVAQNVY